jgi:WD40 repeat protein
LWNVDTRRRLAVLASRGSGQVPSVAFSPGGRTLAVGEAIGTVHLWRVASRAVTATLAAPGADPVNSAAFSPDGKRVAAAGQDGSVYVWDVASRRVIATLTDTRIDPSTGTRLGAATDATFSPDGAMLAASYADGSADVWDVATRKVVANLPDWASAVEVSGAATAMFSQDGRRGRR